MEKTEFFKISLNNKSIRAYFSLLKTRKFRGITPEYEVEMTILHFLLFLQDLQDDLGDMLEEANEVQEALGRSYGKP